jgi:hypothetical protein
MRQHGYITIEENTGAASMNGIAALIAEEFPNIEIAIMEDTSYYFVLKFLYDDFVDVQEIVSTIAYILCGEGIHKYTTTLNCNE